MSKNKKSRIAKGLGASALAVATLASGLSFGAASASAVPEGFAPFYFTADESRIRANIQGALPAMIDRGGTYSFDLSRVVAQGGNSHLQKHASLAEAEQRAARIRINGNRFETATGMCLSAVEARPVDSVAYWYRCGQTTTSNGAPLDQKVEVDDQGRVVMNAFGLRAPLAFVFSTDTGYYMAMNTNGAVTPEGPFAGRTLSASGSFDADLAQRAKITGTAVKGATVVIKMGTIEVGRVTADANDGSFSWDVPAPMQGGTKSYTVSQIVSGTESGNVAVNLDFGKAVEVTTPADQSEQAQGTTTISGRGENGSSVVVSVNGRQLPATTVANGSWSVQGELARGENRIEAVQKSKGANTTTSTVVVNPGESGTVELTAAGRFDDQDSWKPAIGFGAAPTGSTVVLRNAAGIEVGRAVAQNDMYEITIDPTKATYGVNTFSAVIVGDEGTVKSFTLDYGQAPTALDITSPTNGSTVVSNGLTFRGTGQSGAKVDIRGTSRAIATGFVEANGQWSVANTVNLKNDVYALKGVQTTKGGKTTEQAITITISDRTEARVTASAAFNAVDQFAPAIVSGTGEPGAAITVKNAAGDIVGTTTVGSNGRYQVSVDPKHATYGVNTFTATQTVGGKNDTASATLDYGTAPANPVIATPAQNATVSNDKITFSGTGQAGAQMLIRGTSSTVSEKVIVGLDGRWSVELNRTLTPMDYRLFAVQTTKGGLAKQVDRTITVVEKQTVALTAKGAFSSDVTQNAIISGNAETGASVVVREGATVIGTVTAVDGKYSLAVPATVEGVRNFQVTQNIDGETSAPVSASLDYGTVTPLVVSSPADGSTVAAGAVTYTGTGTPGAQIRVGGTVSQLGTATVNAQGEWTLTLSRNLTPSTYTLFVKQTVKGNLAAGETVSNITVR